MSVNLLCLSLLTTNLISAMTQYSFPVKKSSSSFSYAVYKNKKVTNGIIPNKMETHTNYQKCVTACYSNIAGCKSIGVEILNNTTLNCQFFNYFPPTYISDGFLVISIVQPSCSQSCNLALNPCGKCDCHPSCSGRNRRQHVCNCTGAAGVAKSCQEHHDRGFIITGIFQINPNGILLLTVCEMDKVERQNPVIKKNCMLQSNLPLRGTTYVSLNPIDNSVSSISYCVQWCADKITSQNNIDMLLYRNSVCECVNSVSGFRSNSNQYEGSYCYIDRSSTNCKLSTATSDEITYSKYNIYDVPYDANQCVSSCKSYQLINPTSDGYIASGIVANDRECKCLYGNRGFDNGYQYGCSFEAVLPTQTFSNIKGVWIPLMTRFASWDSSFWAKSFDAYENGFGLVNQQWIGLKKLYEITNAFVTDMRVDYTFKEDLTFSTMYYNISVSSKSNNYMFSYSAYDSRGSDDPDWFNANGMAFQSCKNWWTTTCADNAMYPTTISYISYGKTENVESIQFLLRTSYTK